MGSATPWRAGASTATPRSWTRNIGSLVLIDVREHGGSDKPHEPEAAAGLVQRLADLVTVLDNLGIDRAHYFGYSLGGLFGLGLAKHAPDRIRSLSIGGRSRTAKAWNFTVRG
jgi:pimeloyl-ACP methyl ester carboxylesterase